MAMKTQTHDRYRQEEIPRHKRTGRICAISLRRVDLVVRSYGRKGEMFGWLNVANDNRLDDEHKRYAFRLDLLIHEG
jgi:hypothetical protein